MTVFRQRQMASFIKCSLQIVSVEHRFSECLVMLRTAFDVIGQKRAAFDLALEGPLRLTSLDVVVAAYCKCMLTLYSEETKSLINSIPQL